MQEARKWLLRPNFFSSSKWAQFLHVTLDLKGKRCPEFFLLFCFSFSRNFLQPALVANVRFADSIVWKNKSFLWKGHRQEKNCVFALRYFWKMKEKPANLNRGVCFSMNWKATCRNWAHLNEEKKFGLKSHLRASRTQPFNFREHFLHL